MSDPVRAVLARWWLVLSIAVIGGLVGCNVVLIRPERWSSTSVMSFNVTDPAQGVLDSAPTVDPGPALASQTSLAFSDSTVQAVSRETGLSSGTILADVSVEVSADDFIVRITAVAGSADQALRLASAMTSTYVDANREAGLATLTTEVNSLQQSIDQINAQLTAPGAGSGARADSFQTQAAVLTQRQIQLRAAAASYQGQLAVVSAARRATSPDGLGMVQAVALGAGLGLVIGCLAAVYLSAQRARWPDT